MIDFRKYLSKSLFAAVALLIGASPTFAADAPSLGAASKFAVLSAASAGGGAVTCTDSTITGDVGSSGARPSVVKTRCTITGAIVAPVSAQVLTDFDSAYAALAAETCTNITLTGLGGQTLLPGVYCFDAAVTETNTVLTLAGSSSDVWIFKIGTGGTGALTGTNFSVVMANGAQPCNVYWWVAQAVTMTDSDFKGTILAGAAITVTRGTFAGRALAKAAVTMTGVAATGCGGGSLNPAKSRCNQGVGNGPEGCDPGNSNQGTAWPFGPNSNDEVGGLPGSPGRKGGNSK